MNRARRDNKTLQDLADALRRNDFDSARKVIQSHSPSTPQPQRQPSAPQPSMTLAQACDGWANPRSGQLAIVRRPCAEYLPQLAPVCASCMGVLRGARQRLDELEASAALCHAASVSADEILFAAIEHLGPPDREIFLIGAMFVESGQLVIEQFFLLPLPLPLPGPDGSNDRDGSGGRDGDVLSAFAAKYAAARVVVAFNSSRRSAIRNFLARCKANGVDPLADAWEAPQRAGEQAGPISLDLRKECRSRWGREASSLTSAERRLLGRARDTKLPRSELASVWENYLATGNAFRVGDILSHNAMDLLTSAQLLCNLLTGWDTVRDD